MACEYPKGSMIFAMQIFTRFKLSVRSSEMYFKLFFLRIKINFLGKWLSLFRPRAPSVDYFRLHCWSRFFISGWLFLNWRQAAGRCVRGAGRYRDLLRHLLRTTWHRSWCSTPRPSTSCCRCPLRRHGELILLWLQKKCNTHNKNCQDSMCSTPICATP